MSRKAESVCVSEREREGGREWERVGELAFVCKPNWWQIYGLPLAANEFVGIPRPAEGVKLAS